jgi:hypothetical protein
MAKRYLPVLRDQPVLLPPDMRDWLPPDHPVWLVITVVEDHLDTSAFRARRRTGKAGAAPATPAAPSPPATPAPPSPPWPNASKPTTASPPAASAATSPKPPRNIKHNLGIRQFTLRGKPKVTAGWNLTTAVRNLLKAISTGNLTTQTLTTP